MSTRPVVTFDPDPTRSPHALVAFGSSLAPAADPARARGLRLWARITIYTGGADGVTPARDAVLMLAPILTWEALWAAPVPEPYADVWARACDSTKPPPPEDRENAQTFGGGSLGGAAPAAPAQYGAAQQRDTNEEVFTKVRDHTRRHGSHPNFQDQDPTKVNNYITSISGKTHTATTLKYVRDRLAAEM